MGRPKKVRLLRGACKKSVNVPEETNFKKPSDCKEGNMAKITPPKLSKLESETKGLNIWEKIPNPSYNFSIPLNSVKNTQNSNKEIFTEKNNNSILNIKETPKRNPLSATTNLNYEYAPVPLLNRGENICFFNSVIQVLFAIKPMRERVILHDPLNQDFITINRLFRAMIDRTNPVRTSRFLDRIMLPHYQKGTQFDSHEFLRYILDKVYPVVDDTCEFKILLNTSISCQISSCQNIVSNNVASLDIVLNIWKTTGNTVTELLNNYLSQEYVDEYRCDQCNAVGSCYKKHNIMTFQKFVIFQLISGIYDPLTGHQRKLPFSIDVEEILTINNRPCKLIAVICHHGENVNCGHYTANVRKEQFWFKVDDHRVTSGVKLNYTYRDEALPYILIYQVSDNISNGVEISSNSNTFDNSLNFAITDSKLVSSNTTDPEEMLREALKSELQKQKRKLSEASTTAKVNEAELSPKYFKKRKLSFPPSNSSSRVNKYRKKLAETEKLNLRRSAKEEMKIYRKNLDDIEKSKLKASDQARKHKFRENLDEIEKSKLKASEQARKQKSRENLDEIEKLKLKASDQARKQKSRENLDENEKSKFKASAKKRMENLRRSLDEPSKTTIKQKDRNRKEDQRNRSIFNREKAFDQVKESCMVDPEILETEAFRIIQNEYNSAVNEGPTLICNICWKFEFKTNVLNLVPSRYEADIYNKCKTEKSNHICNSCHKSLLKGRMPMQAQSNKLRLCPKLNELEQLCPIETMLVSQIIPFMFIVGKAKGAQHGLKGQCVMVPADLSKIQKVLPRTFSSECLISLALKRRLSDRSSVNKQYVRPSILQNALVKLVEVNKFYSNVIEDEQWQELSRKHDPELWKNLTENHKDEVDDYENLTDSDEEESRENDNQTGKFASIPYPTVMHNVDGPNISTNQIVEIAPGEGQLPVSFFTEPDWEALCFIKEYPTAKNHYNEKRDVHITPSKYVHARLKSCDDRFASNPQYIFQCLDWIEKNAVTSSIHFAERKRYQSDIKAGQLTNSSNVMRMISDDQIFASFKNIRGTPQYFHGMLLDVLAKIRQFGTYTFFLTCSAAEFHWTHIIKVVARQYGKELNDEEINNMDWSEKCCWLKRNPVTVARMIDKTFRELWGKVILSGMHPIGQILNYDDRREFQNRGIEHFHAPIHVVDAPEIDKDDDKTVTDFIDRYITCSLPDKDKYPEHHELVKKYQTHNHTFTCGKKKGVKCRFDFPCPPSNETRIVRANDDKDKQAASKKILQKVLVTALTLPDLSSITVTELLEMSCVSKEEYNNSLQTVKNKLTIIYKRNPDEIFIGPYNTVILSLLRANMNIQYVTGVYAMLMYITSYLCKPERTMSEFMKKASKEADRQDIQQKMRKIGNVFLTKREVSTHEAIKRVLSLPLRFSNVDVVYVPTGLKKNRIRMLKSQTVLESMDPDDSNVFASSIVDRYENRPNSLEDMCLADFASNYVYKGSKEKKEDDIESYTIPVSSVEPEKECTKVIKLKNGLGEMRKRSRPCVIRFHKVSKLENAEEYFLRVLQLYLPWRNEINLKNANQSYEQKYEEVKDIVMPNLQQHEPFTDIDYEDLHNFDMLDSDSDNDDDSEYSIFNPRLMDLDNDENSNSQGNNTVPAQQFQVQCNSMTNEMFYESCSQLNKGQRHLFYFFMEYAIMCRFNERNDKCLPDPFHIFLSGGGGVGKSFIVHLITEYLRRILRYPTQSLNQPSILVTASTGKAATAINGTTLHSAFKLPINRAYIRPRDESLHEMRIKYQYLKVLLIDEISMVGADTFSHLNLALQLIMNNSFLFGGVSILVIGDLLQLPPVNQQGIFSCGNENTYKALAPSLWRDVFKLHELFEIVRQSSDPEFANLLSRVREDEHTDEDLAIIKSLADTDTSAWPEQYVKLFLTNYLAGKENEDCISKLGTEIKTIKSADSAKDLESGTYNIAIPENINISQTGNLVNRLKVCKNARVMLTDNVNIPEKLINGSIGTVKAINVNPRNFLAGEIYIKFDDKDAGHTLKNRSLPGELKECVPIVAKVKPFPFSKSRRGKTITVQRKQYPLMLAHGMTIHKSQGSSLEFMLGDLDTSTGKTKPAPINQGQFYTLLSRAKRRDQVKLLNFKPEYIKVNKSALEEMERMRKDDLFIWEHPADRTSNSKICLHNIRSWDKHIENFVTMAELFTCDILCFTETNINSNPRCDISNYLEGWLDIHKPTTHGLAVCYNVETVKIIAEFEPLSNIEMIPLLIEIRDETLLLVVIYRTGPLSNFIECLTEDLQCFPSDYRKLIVGDFNLDQLSALNRDIFRTFCDEFNLYQRSNYTTHVQGGILDLVFDSHNDEEVSWIPSPFSDHFVMLIST